MFRFSRKTTIICAIISSFCCCCTKQKPITISNPNRHTQTHSRAFLYFFVGRMSFVSLFRFAHFFLFLFSRTRLISVKAHFAFEWLVLNLIFFSSIHIPYIYCDARKMTNAAPNAKYDSYLARIFMTLCEICDTSLEFYFFPATLFDR